MALIETYDDKKGKWQSWEATINLQSDSIQDPNLIGYGATEEEAVAALKKDLRAYIELLQAAESVDITTPRA
ncbi:hypothetical protein [Hymenobacter mucosus]|uniref:HicB_like antitoxin of toxin-antitoxin system n=1 Tax=Hymenobacter mucosus TaxID=1411120 RepID=A0A239ABJ5_9BACT|nr:hypothetical protein [Hymenobacter mucosus]SNR92243.1 hypothetical protein SAMN06269173_11186 [Hymenobacter mucosus]